MKTKFNYQKGENGLMQIIFNSKAYSIYASNKKYYRRGRKYLHHAVWEFYNDMPVPKGYHIHHLDGNKYNNCITNLECIEGVEHITRHQRAIFANGKKPNWFQKWQGAGSKAAVKWHQSEEGRAKHSKVAIEVWKKRKELQ